MSKGKKKIISLCLGDSKDRPLILSAIDLCKTDLNLEFIEAETQGRKRKLTCERENVTF
jgi:hypothetical protein